MAVQVQEECSEQSPCQGLKLAISAGVIEAVDVESPMAIMRDGFLLPDENFFALIKTELAGGIAEINEYLPIDTCPFCGFMDYVSNSATAALG